MTDSLSFENHDHTDIRVQEAKLLRGNALNSARAVMILVVLITLMLYFSERPFEALMWFIATSIMVVFTILYARFRMREGIDRTNVYNYLYGHLILTALTGSTWIAFAIYLIDFDSYISIFITSFFLSSITLGGMMPGAVYRPGFIVLASVTLLPFGVFLVFQDDVLIKLFGVGYFAYYLFGTVISSKNDGTIKEGIKAAVNREFLEEIYEKSMEIQRLNDVKTQFLTSISHDMSQPLLAQRHFIASLRKFAEKPEHQKLLKDIEAAQHNQEQLHRDLVEFNQIKEAKIPVNKESFDIQFQLEALVSEFKPMADYKDIKLQSDIPSYQLYTDPKLLNRILRNILSNAIKYTQPEGLVEICCEQKNNYIQIIISDNGPGIPNKDLANVFDEYVRLENAGYVEGFGMGLSIVKRLTKIINGTVGLSTNSSGGTDATITLPIEVEQFDNAQPIATIEIPTLLVVSDVDRKEFGGWSNLISQWSWAAIVSDSLTEAVDLAMQTEVLPDMIIIDLCTANEHDLQSVITTLSQTFEQDTPIMIIGDGNTSGNVLVQKSNVQLVANIDDIPDFKIRCENLLKKTF